MTTKRDGSKLASGWCFTGYHEECDNFYMKQSYGKERGCACPHHETTKKVDKKPTKK